MEERIAIELMFLLVCVPCAVAQEEMVHHGWTNCSIPMRCQERLAWVNVSTLPNDTMRCLEVVRQSRAKLEETEETLREMRDYINKRREARHESLIPEPELEAPIPEMQECSSPIKCNEGALWGQYFIRDPVTSEATTKCKYEMWRGKVYLQALIAEHKLIARELEKERKMQSTAHAATTDDVTSGFPTTEVPVEASTTTVMATTTKNDVTSGFPTTEVPVEASTTTVMATTMEKSAGEDGLGTATDIYSSGTSRGPESATCPNNREVTTTQTTSDSGLRTFNNCEDAKIFIGEDGGVTNITHDATTYEVYCDMKTDCGNWIVFQRRMDGSVDFDRTWEEYATGFGNKAGEFWLGLETIHQLTQNGSYELRVDLTDWDGSTAYAKYGNFSISGRSDGYRLTVAEYSGNAGDSLSQSSNGRQFSTKEKDLDEYVGNCAARYHAAWWFSKCGTSSLNGRYNDISDAHSGVYWHHWGNRQPYSLKAAEMKFRKK